MTGLEAILPTIVTALVPVAAEGIRGLFNWYTRGAGAQPANVEERIKLMDADTNRLRALAELDAPAGNISVWVADLRASFRYLGAAVTLAPVPIMLLWTLVSPTPERVDVLTLYTSDFCGPVWGFLFGDRLRVHMRR